MLQGGKNALTVNFGPLSRRPAFNIPRSHNVDYAGSSPAFIVWLVDASQKTFSSANWHLSRELLGSKPIVCKREMKAMVVNIVRESWRACKRERVLGTNSN